LLFGHEGVKQENSKVRDRASEFFGCLFIILSYVLRALVSRWHDRETSIMEYSKRGYDLN
jgi:hypothetical protein